MIILMLGLLVMLGVHSLQIVSPQARTAAIARIGRGGYSAAYSVASVVGLALIVWGYGLARRDPVVIYDPPTWLRHISLTLMIPVFPLLLAAYFPGRIKARLKHPMLVAVKLWAFAHLLANGTLADVLLFGGFLAWAVADRISVKRHPRQGPPAAAARGSNDMIAIIGGLAIYAALVGGLHAWLFGVSPLG